MTDAVAIFASTINRAMCGDSEAVCSLRSLLRIFSRTLDDRAVIEVSQLILTLRSKQDNGTLTH